METLQVQSAGAVAPTLPASTVSSGTPTGDDSFALTLGRALENMPSSVQNGSSTSPEAPPASPREKVTAGGSTDPSSMAGVLFNCFIANIIQPSPTVTLSTEAPEPTVSLQSPKPTLGSLPSFVSSLNATTVEASTSTGPLSIPVALRDIAAPDALSARAGKVAVPAGTAHAAITKSTPRVRGQAAVQSRGLVATPGQDQSESTTNVQPGSAPAWFPEPQDDPLPSQPVEQQVGGALSESKPVQASNPLSAQEPGSRQKSQASSNFTDSWPQVQHVDPAQMQATRQSPSNQNLQVATDPPQSPGQSQPATPGFGPQATDSSTPVSATNYPELAEFSSLLAKFAGASVQAASNPPPSTGQTPAAAPASGQEASDRSTPVSTTNNPEPAEFSSLPGSLAGAEVQAASNPPLSAGQTQSATPVFGPQTTESSTPISATDHPEVAEFSSLRGRFAGANVQAASNPPQSGGQTPQAAPTFGSEASDTYTPVSATDHPEVAEFSSLLGKFADTDLPVASNPTLSAGQAGLDAAALRPERRDSPTSVSATDHPEVARFSTLMGELVGGQIDLKVSGNVVQPATAADKFTPKSTPVAVDTLSGGPSMTAVEAVQIPPAPKAENLGDTPAKGTVHSAPVSGNVAAEVVGQEGTDPEPASVQAPLSSSASPVAPLQLNANPQPAPPATTLQNDAAPKGIVIQLGGTAYNNSGETGAHANLSDSSTSGQGKSGQQSGTAAGDNPAIVIPTAASVANTPAADSTASLLPPQASSVPVSHASAPAPPPSPSSSQPPTTLSAWQNYDGGAGNMVRSASLSGSANGAEMHVELRSGALGPMDVHAVMHEGSVGAEIHVQGQEAHTLLAAGLPSLERALGERNLRVENISVYQDQAGGGMSGGGKQDPHSGSSPSPQHKAMPWDNPPPASKSASGSSEDEELANPAAGLSVRA